jgi:hypothetical protein
VPNLPDVSSLSTEHEVLAVRASLPRLSAGDPLQGYKWALSMRLRRLRSLAAGKADLEAIDRMFANASNECQLCGEDMRFWITGRWATLDHIVALANGGTNETNNLRVICNRCNSRKADRA